jgi:alanine-glyoxylate transaminase/serine-glyoxylate transaminase/serine-pyruvate transaminase
MFQPYYETGLEIALHGPGPSNVHPDVLKAMSAPTIGHLDTRLLEVMDDTQSKLKELFRVEDDPDAYTLAVSGTGSAGMEFLVANLTEPEDNVLVIENGVFGSRIADCVERFGGQVSKIDLEWGTTLSPDRLETEIKRRDYSSVWVVHAETSTGALQPDMKKLGKIIRDHDALFLVDCVTSLGGVDVNLKEWDVDAAYSGTQKCLSVPPGLAPVVLRQEALDWVKGRNCPIGSWYFNSKEIGKYWDQGSPKRVYHHTAPVNNICSLHRGLGLILDERLDRVFARHKENAELLQQGLEALGFEYVVENADQRLPMLHTVYVPQGVDEAQLRKKLLTDYNLEIGAGLGDFQGIAVRIGLMGYSSQRENVEYLTESIKRVLPRVKR